MECLECDLILLDILLRNLGVWVIPGDIGTEPGAGEQSISLTAGMPLISPKAVLELLLKKGSSCNLLLLLSLSS